MFGGYYLRYIFFCVSIVIEVKSNSIKNYLNYRKYSINKKCFIFVMI